VPLLLEPRPSGWWRRLPGGAGALPGAERERRRLKVFLLAVVAAVAVSFAQASGPWRLAEGRAFDYLSTIAAPERPADGPVVVAIDEPSFAELNLQWPWPRSLHARLVDALRDAGARAVGLDIVFAEPSASPAADKALGASTAPDTVLAADETVIRTPQADQRLRTEPLPALLARGAAAGLASVVLDGDGTLRRVPPFADGFAATLLRRAGEEAAGSVPEDALLQSFGPARTYPTVSFYQALDPEHFLPPDFFRGRVVIVGLSMQAAPTVDAGGADVFATSWTPRTGRLVAGAEVQANVFDNLAHKLFVSPLPPLGAVALAALGAALAAAAVWRSTGWRTLLWAALTLAVLGAGSFLVLRFGRVYAPPLGAGLAFLLVAGAQGARDYAAERRLRQGITRAFSQYVSPVVVERLAANPSLLKLGGVRRTLSILFCDVRGFTTISERMKDDPEGLTRLINRLLDPLTRTVMDHGGTIDKYIGDAVMAFWNAPLDDPDHALHAVEAALAMHEALERLNAELEAEASAGEPPITLKIGVGVNTGDCVVGNLGSSLRFDYSVLGDAVNLASRLEGETKRLGVGVALGERTATAIGARMPLALVDRVRVKGKTEAVAVSTVAPGAAPALLETHRRLVEDALAGRLAAGDARLALLRRDLPMLAGFYDTLETKASSAAA
jgi:adenylate cyclase